MPPTPDNGTPPADEPDTAYKSQVDKALLSIVLSPEGKKMGEQVASVLLWAAEHYPREVVSWAAIANAVFGIVGDAQERAVKDAIVEAEYAVLIAEGRSVRYDHAGARVLIDSVDADEWLGEERARRKMLRALLRGNSNEWSRRRKAGLLLRMSRLFPTARQDHDADPEQFWSRVVQAQDAYRAEPSARDGSASAWLKFVSR